jgi:hypothetical protein
MAYPYGVQETFVTATPYGVQETVVSAVATAVRCGSASYRYVFSFFSPETLQANQFRC